MNAPLYLAWEHCTQCSGSGRRPRCVCKCVWRRAFRIASARLEREPPLGAVAFARHACYCADVLLAARAACDARELAMFRMRWEEGLEWPDIALRTRMDRGEVFHALYRIEATVGEEIVARRLHLTGEYFAGIAKLRAHAQRNYMHRVCATHGISQLRRIDWHRGMLDFPRPRTRAIAA